MSVKRLDETTFPKRMGRHLLLKRLGEGAMGQVFLAISGGRICAVKALLPNEDDEHIIQRFLDEAQLITRLSHPNLVYVSEICRCDGRQHLVMEYVRGKTLFELWRKSAEKREPIPRSIALFIVREILNGLTYMHEAPNLDLVHRDLVPANVMLSYEGAVKIIDFGLAKWLAKTTETLTGFQWGHSSYRSPEQLRGFRVDARSDVYAVGVILWELLTARIVPSPEPGAGVDMPPPSRLASGIPRRLDEVVLRAIAPDPASRFQTAREFAAALTPMLTAEYDTSRLKEYLASVFENETVEEAREEETLTSAASALVEDAPAEEPFADDEPGVDERSGASVWRRRALIAGVCAVGLAGAIVTVAALWPMAPRPVAGNPAAERGALPQNGPSAQEDPPRPQNGASASNPTASPDSGDPPEATGQTEAPPVATEPSPPPRRPDRKTSPRLGVGDPGEAQRSVSSMIESAEAAFRAGDFQQARAHAEGALRLDRADVDARLLLAKVLIAMKDYDRAALQYRTVLKSAPDNVAAKRGLELATASERP